MLTLHNRLDATRAAPTRSCASRLDVARSAANARLVPTIPASSDMDQTIKRGINMLLRLCATAIVMTGMIGAAQAACPPPFTFTNGTSANANEVNANFMNVSNCNASIDNPVFTGSTATFTGSVGIGTPYPFTKLEVVGSADYEANIYARSTNTNGARFGLKNTLREWTFSNWGSSSGSEAGVLAIAEGYNVWLAINPAGNVGIGTYTPAYKLDVSGIVSATSVHTPSDGRLKEKITPIEYGLDTIMKLNPVGFNWRDQKHEWQKPRQIGFIAQEVQSVVPEVVSRADDDAGTYSLAYAELIPVLVKAMQQQQARILALESKIEKIGK